MPESSNPPTRIGGTGHQGLPRKTTELVAVELQRILASYAPHMIGITCLADGADQLFARAVLSLGGQLDVVVPADKYRDGLDPLAQPTYDNLIASARDVHLLPFIESTEEAHFAGGQAVVDRSELLVAVWDGRPPRASVAQPMSSRMQGAEASQCNLLGPGVFTVEVE